MVTKQDLRPQDIAKLEKAGVESDWVRLWESEFSKEIDNIQDENQKLWHLSRLSFLAGFKLEKIGKKTEEVELP
jgi:hypothetical protein